MSKFLAGLGGNAGAMIAGGGMALVIGLGAYIGLGRGDVTQVAVAPLTTSEPAAAPEATQTPQATAPVQSTAQIVPEFDELRREEDGTTIIAGRAAPQSEISILIDGVEIATATADSTGGFAAITNLPATDTAQVVSLSSQGAGQGIEAVASLDEIILAPRPTPPQVAPQDEPQPDQQLTASEPQSEQQAAAPAKAEAAQSEPASVAVLASDAEGVRLLNPASPQAQTSVALDTIGYSEQGDVQLSGRAQPEAAQVRIYLDNRSIINLPIDAQGQWEGDLPDVDAGVYTLRVDEVDAEGDVSSRVETPFKRETAQALAAATPDAAGPISSVTVQAGATLWAIARDRYGDGTLYLRVVEANAANIRNPDLIYPGQVFDLPD